MSLSRITAFLLLVLLSEVCGCNTLHWKVSGKLEIEMLLTSLASDVACMMVLLGARALPKVLSAFRTGTDWAVELALLAVLFTSSVSVYTIRCCFYLHQTNHAECLKMSPTKRDHAMTDSYVPIPFNTVPTKAIVHVACLL